jgi:hypothetical protein
MMGFAALNPCYGALFDSFGDQTGVPRRTALDV